MKKKVGIAILGVVIAILAWAPWLHRDMAIEKVKSSENFIYQNRDNESGYPIVFRIPFGYWITTPEGGWMVTFWGKVI